MAEVKWIKIVTDIFDDEKILLVETLPEADSIIVIWFKLLCLAGKTNNSGVFIFNGMPYTDSMLSTIFRRKESTVKLALKTFEQFGMIEIINDTITIPNWGKHQNLDKLEAKKEYMRDYMASYRAKQKAITDGKSNCKTNSKTNVSSLDKIRVEEDKEGDIEKDTTRKKQSPRFDHTHKAYKCATYLDAKVCDLMPNKKAADEVTLQKWADAFDKTNRINGYEWDLIGEVLEFSQEDDFWKTNILSGDKFRKQFDQLYAKMRGKK